MPYNTNAKYDSILCMQTQLNNVNILAKILKYNTGSQQSKQKDRKTDKKENNNINYTTVPYTLHISTTHNIVPQGMQLPSWHPLHFLRD